MLAASGAHGQEADPIGALLAKEQAAETPPAAAAPSDAIVTAPQPATPAPAAPIGPPPEQTPPAAQPASAPAPAPTTPSSYAPPAYTPPPARPLYTPPPVYTPPQAPLPYVNTAPPPVTYAPRRPQLTAPVHIDETGKTPEGPPTPTDLNYEARMRSSFASAQGMQGPLDGAWSLKGGGAELYDLQIVDTGNGRLEGAWRDPRRRGAVDASGFIDDIDRSGAQLTLRLIPRQGADPVTAILMVGPDGAWTGDLTERGERRAVTMRRN